MNLSMPHILPTAADPELPADSSLLKPGISIRTEGRVRIDADWKPVGVTDQFLENAETYHSRYFRNGFGKGNFRNSVVARALDIACVDLEAPLRVLDIGSGSGNTVVAAAELLPNSAIFASDISPQLLQILARFQDQVPALEGRIQAYCFDLHKDFFVDGIFDIVHGNAILHHLLDPEAALRNVARWVRPGGKILLAEPMEVGGHMLAAVYLTLLSELEEEADPRLARHFKALCEDFEARFGIPRVKPWTPNLDDKWFFHASYLRRMAANLGLTLEKIAPTVTDLRNLFRNTVHGHIMAAGLADVPVPARMREILERFDAGILAGLKKLFAPAGIVVLAKPGAGA